jgi:nucleoid-associated protein EbfC
MSEENSPEPGFDMGGGLMDKLLRVREEMRRAQEELGEQRITVSVGGDAVLVVIDGKQRLHHVTIAPEALAAAQDDREMLQDLLVAAFNSAIEQSQTMAAERLQGLTSGLDLPGL